MCDEKQLHLQHSGHEVAVITVPYSIIGGSPAVNWIGVDEGKAATISVELLCLEGHKESIKEEVAGRLIVRDWVEMIQNKSISAATFICTRVSETEQCGDLCRIWLLYEVIRKEYDAEGS